MENSRQARKKNATCITGKKKTRRGAGLSIGGTTRFNAVMRVRSDSLSGQVPAWCRSCFSLLETQRDVRHKAFAT
jgi:hypothetical protein